MSVDEFGEIRVPFIRSAFNYDMSAASLESGLFCEDGTRTQQQFKEECDINTIVERFGVTGELPTGVSIPYMADFSESVTDFQTALNMIKAADEAFMAYPASIRSQFENDPERFVAFVSDPANKDQVKAWGLARAEMPLPAPIEVRVIPNPPDPTKTAPVAAPAAGPVST